MIPLCAALLSVVPSAVAGPAPQDVTRTPLVVEARLVGQAITPPTVRFLTRALAHAELQGAECLLVVLDTPGGLVDSTRELVRAMLAARVPVVVYVPPGGRAASAGTFVLLAAHVAAMGPGSNVGAAHPVQVGGLPIAPPGEAAPGDEGGAGGAAEVMERKAVEDTTAWARALAEARGRDAEWAARAVTESRSASAREALEGGIVDLLAADVDELLALLDGRTVTLGRRTLTLNTARARTEVLEPWWGEELLAVIANPNVAFLLLVFGVYGLLFELYSPGWGVAGTLGTVSLLIGFFALSVLPVDYAGLALVLVAFALFVAEAFVTSFGALTLGGIACLTLGGLMLVDSPAGFMRLSLEVVLPVAAATGLIVAFLVAGIVRAQRSRVRTGAEGMSGERAEALEDFVAAEGAWVGLVRTHGELWRARSAEPVHAGEALEVRRQEGLTLQVAAGGPPPVP